MILDYRKTFSVPALLPNSASEEGGCLPFPASQSEEGKTIGKNGCLRPSFSPLKFPRKNRDAPERFKSRYV